MGDALIAQAPAMAAALKMALETIEELANHKLPAVLYEDCVGEIRRVLQAAGVPADDVEVDHGHDH